MVIIFRNIRNKGQEGQSMVGNLPQIEGECSYSREQASMAMRVGNDRYGQELDAEKR